MQTITTFYLVRHGEVKNPQNIFYGRLPRFSLSAAGWDQAKSLRSYFLTHPPTVVYSSPLLRARQTARAILGEQNRLPIRVSQLISEVNTPFDHHPISEIEARAWDIFSGTAEIYEQPADVLARTQKFISKVLHAYPGGSILVVTHAIIISFLTLWAGDKPIQIDNRESLLELGLPPDFPPPASMTRFIYTTQESGKLPSFVFNETHGNAAA